MCIRDRRSARGLENGLWLIRARYHRPYSLQQVKFQPQGVAAPQRLLRRLSAFPDSPYLFIDFSGTGYAAAKIVVAAQRRYAGGDKISKSGWGRDDGGVPAHRLRKKCSLLQAPPYESRCDVVPCLLYTSDAADDLLCVDLGGRRI